MKSSKNIPSITDLIGLNLINKDFITIDLSASNVDLLNFDTSSSKEWSEYINSYLKRNSAIIAYGGYLEIRNLYERSQYFSSLSENDKRNIHLGVDLWCPENTPISSIFDAKVHSFNNNTNHGDYGPTIILEHKINSIRFYTLYGHLSLESIQNKSKGQQINKGDIFCHLGDSVVNGDYSPHLHFQIILDLESNNGDYPGVCSKNTLNHYKSNCPNLQTLLNILYSEK